LETGFYREIISGWKLAYIPLFQRKDSKKYMFNTGQDGAQDFIVLEVGEPKGI